MPKKIENTFHENSQAVQAHLEITQSAIQRMADNSASCKTWCITLVSAILVVIADKGKPQYALIAIIPTALFLILDSYYLMLEKMFRESYNGFINKLHNDKIVETDLYSIKPDGNRIKAFFASIFSFSVFPFYLTLLVMVWITMSII